MNEAQRERLAMLIEEAGEVIQAATKILRHGYDSYHPKDPKLTSNRIQLQEELVDLLSVMDAMEFNGDMSISDKSDSESLDYCWQKKLKYTHHQR
jgi:NTP pyrophosphatase (non-canonical NTP hydrolase)